MPALGKGFLQTLLNAPVKLRTARLRWTELGRPKMRSDGLRPLPIPVDVAHSFPRGLLLADSSKAVLEKVPASGSSSLRTQRVECIAPGPWFSIGLLLDVDDASLGTLGLPSLAGGSTGVSSQSGLHRYVNRIAVTEPMEGATELTERRDECGRDWLGSAVRSALAYIFLFVRSILTQYCTILEHHVIDFEVLDSNFGGTTCRRN